MPSGFRDRVQCQEKGIREHDCVNGPENALHEAGADSDGKPYSQVSDHGLCSCVPAADAHQSGHRALGTKQIAADTDTDTLKRSKTDFSPSQEGVIPICTEAEWRLREVKNHQSEMPLLISYKM